MAMEPAFDAYHKWLGIAREGQPFVGLFKTYSAGIPVTCPARTSAIRCSAKAVHSARTLGSSGSSERSRYWARAARSLTDKESTVPLICSKVVLINVLRVTRILIQRRSRAKTDRY